MSAFFARSRLPCAFVARLRIGGKGLNVIVRRRMGVGLADLFVAAARNITGLTWKQRKGRTESTLGCRLRAAARFAARLGFATLRQRLAVPAASATASAPTSTAAVAAIALAVVVILDGAAIGSRLGFRSSV